MCQHDFDYNHSAVHVCCVVTPSIMFAMMRLSSSSLCQFSLQYWCVYHFYHAHSPISVLFASPWVVLLNPMLLEVWYYSMMAIEMTNCFVWATMPISCVLIICYYTKTTTIYIFQCQVWSSGQLGTVPLTQQVRGQCFCGWIHHTKIYFVLCPINWIWWKGATILNVDGSFDTIMRAAWFCLLLQPRPVNKHLKLLDSC